MEVLSKDKIERWILPYLSKGKRGPEPGVPLWQVIQAILYRLKSGCQWRMLPLACFFDEGKISCDGVFYYHSKWVKDGSWKKVWIALLKEHKSHLDLSTMQLDGSHTPCKKQAEQVGYQGRKSARTTNALILADNSGQPVALATPQPGNHHDLFEIEVLFEEMYALLTEAGIDLKGVFMNADAGFDAEALRQQCSDKDIEANIASNERGRKEPSQEYVPFDEELYKRRFVVEQANSWLDGFKTLLVRYEVLLKTWIAAHLMAFTVLFLRKINPC
jgi:transposase